MKKGSKDKKLRFYNMFWLLIFGSVFGWICEVLFSLLIDREFINHSALVIGPFDLCYGICACALTFLLYRFKDKGNITIFFISFFLGSILEYIMSFGMELVLGFTSWDYSNMFLNINGRVCLIMSCLWGLLGIVWIKCIYPMFEKIISKMSINFEKKLIIVLSIFLMFDLLLTVSAFLRAKDCEKGIKPSNFYEEMLDKSFNKDYLYNMFSNSWSE